MGHKCRLLGWAMALNHRSTSSAVYQPPSSPHALWHRNGAQLHTTVRIVGITFPIVSQMATRERIDTEGMRARDLCHYHEREGDEEEAARCLLQWKTWNHKMVVPVKPMRRTGGP